MGFAKQSHLLWPLWLAPNLTAGRHRSASPPPVLHNKRVMPLWFQRVYWKSSLSLKRERGKGKEYTPLQYWTFGIKLCRQWKLHDYRLVIAQEQSSKTEPNKESLVHLLDSLALIAFSPCLIFLQLLQVMPYSVTHMCIKRLGVVCSVITLEEVMWREESPQWKDFLLGSSWRASWALQHTRPTGPHFCNPQTGQLPGLQPLACSPLFPMHWGNHSPASCVGLFSSCWFLWDDYTHSSHCSGPNRMEIIQEIAFSWKYL